MLSETCVMFMNAAERWSPSSSARTEQTRSPFARLNDLLAPHQPGRTVIDGSNPGRDYIRVAMVQDNETTAEALHRLAAVLE